MPDEKKIAENATGLAESLLGECAQVGGRNPLQKPLTGIRIVGVVLRDDDTPVAHVSIGMMGTEVLTDAEGKFTLLVEKK